MLTRPAASDAVAHFILFFPAVVVFTQNVPMLRYGRYDACLMGRLLLMLFPLPRFHPQRYVHHGWSFILYILCDLPVLADWGYTHRNQA